MPGLYLGLLLVGLAGMTTIDYRHKLALFLDAIRAALSIGVCVVFFLIWDIAGIGLGVFFEGQNNLLIGLDLAPNLPVEELLFLTLLCYTALVFYQAFGRRRA
jgi:lycopene cyclase domain-containing protein